MAATNLALPPCPAVGEVFELTLDGDDPANQPLALVERTGRIGAFRHEGRLVRGRQTRRFWLVRAGFQPHLGAVQAALAPYGNIPPGQWLEALRLAYRPGGGSEVGVADHSWLSKRSRCQPEYPYHNTHFLWAYIGGCLSFRWSEIDCCDYWRWLVEVR